MSACPVFPPEISTRAAAASGPTPGVRQEHAQCGVVAKRAATYEPTAGRAIVPTISAANRHLVQRIARRFRNRGLEREDLEQLGYEGLVQAMRRYRAARRGDFTAFASFWVEKTIREGIADTGRAVRLPRERLARITRLQRTGAHLRHELHREPTVPELARRAGLSEEQIRKLLADAQLPVSLDAANEPHAELDGDQLLEAHLSDRNRKALVRRSLGSLDACSREVLERRFGLGAHEPQGIVAVAHALGLSPLAARTLERSALAELRRLMTDAPSPA